MTNREKMRAALGEYWRAMYDWYRFLAKHGLTEAYLEWYAYENSGDEPPEMP
jgi:hypothetical protein